MRPIAALSLSLLALSVWAEDAPPAPVPAPAAPEPAPVPPPAPAAPPAEPMPAAAPVAEAPAPATTTAAKPADDGVVFLDPSQRARAAAPPRGRRVGFTATLGAGYDTNVLLENTDIATATDEKSTALFGEVRGQARLVDGDHGRLGVFAGAEINDYPSTPEARLVRYGGGLTASGSLGGFDPGLVAGYNRFLLDSSLAATAFTVNAFLAKVYERNVSVIGAGSQYVDYADNRPITGTLYDVSYRHWFLLDPGFINRRIEVGVRAGRNLTREDENSYRVLIPSAGLLWRFSDKPAFGTQDLSAKASWEFRSYADTATGDSGARQRLLTLSGGYDYWLAPWLSTGAYGAFGKRASTIEADRYDRVQVGVRLNATW